MDAVTARAVLLMAYGTPASLGDVEAYYTHVRHGRPPSTELLAELAGRYVAIGGASPLLEVSHRQAAALEEALGIPVVLGMKHAEPFIEAALDSLILSGVEEIVGLVLAPHYSGMSVGAYEERVRAHLASAPRPPRFRMIRSWHTAPGYLSLLARRVDDALRRVPEELLGRTHVLFTAHSLPESIVAAGDPYPSQLAETARAVATITRWPAWSTAWQSAGRTGARWLGPDVLDALSELAAAGAAAVVVCPCGFVADHLEVLYDLDVEAAARADELGLVMVRTASPNDDPLFVDALAGVAGRELDKVEDAADCGCNGSCRVLAGMESALDKGGM
ncbi:MAG TPA: ferrochelatase [Actinomycetota bacterium]|nr:ferrochelatase [Actinomycetota bacterium]